MRRDALVVGGGVAGMTAAVLLASSGRSVTLVEAHPRLAPTIRGFTRGGRHFDTGLHYLGGLGEGDPLRTYFSHLGLMHSLSPVAYDPEGFDLVRFGENGEDFPVPTGREALEDALTRRFPSERGAVTSYLDAVGRVFDSSPFLNFSRSFSLEGFSHGETDSLAARLSGLTRDRQLWTLLAYPCFLYGVAPEEAPFTIHALVAGSYYRSAHSLEGGGAALARAYYKRLRSLGVELLCGTAVRRLLVSKGCFTGIEMEDRRTLEAQACVWAAHPGAMIRAAPEGVLREPYRQRVRSLEATASAVMLFCDTTEPPSALKGRNLVLWPGGGFTEKLTGRVPMRENVIFIFAGQGRGDAGRSVTILAPADPSRFTPWEESSTGRRPEAYQEEKRCILEELLAEVESRCPHFSGLLNPIDGATPLTLRDWCLAPAGGMYGAKHSLGQINPQPTTRIRGLMLCGQSIVAPGVLGAVVSAYLTCGFLLGHEHLHSQLQEIG